MQLLPGILIFIVLLSSAGAEAICGFDDESIIRKGYTFEFLSSKRDNNHLAMGTFRFKWNGKKSIRIHGFGFEKSGDFRVRFEQVSKLRDGHWTKLPIFSCGTGAELFALRPNKDYRILVPLWRFAKDLEYKSDPPRGGDKGVVKIVGDGFSLISDPFSLPHIPTK